MKTTNEKTKKKLIFLIKKKIKESKRRQFKLKEKNYNKFKNTLYQFDNQKFKKKENKKDKKIKEQIKMDTLTKVFKVVQEKENRIPNNQMTVKMR